MSEGEDDFGALFEASQQAARIRQGQSVEGTIVSLGDEVAVGDRIEAVVVSTSGGVTLSRKLGRGAVTDRQLEDAFHAVLPVEGTVEREVKGGYEVRVARSRAFCPFSQIDIIRGTDAAVHIGRVYTGVEALAHVSTFTPTGRVGGWKALVSPGNEASF